MRADAGFTSERVIGAIIAIAIGCAGLSLYWINQPKSSRISLLQDDQTKFESIAAIDPAMILYVENSDKIDTGLPWARSIAIGPDDRIYVSGGQEIRTFSSAGERLTTSYTAEDEITALTVAEDGTVYLAAGKFIETIDASGKNRNRWDAHNEKSYITSLGLYRDRIFAADFGNRTVHRYDIEGNKIGSFGDFVLPGNYFDLAIDQDGVVHVANSGRHRLEMYSLEGNLISWWGDFSMTDIKGFCGCCNPVNFALLPGNDGYVTCEKGISRVKIYDLEGQLVGIVAGPKQFNHHLSLNATPDYCFSNLGMDVAVDSTGRVLVLDPALAEVRIFTRKQAL